jgi:tetratricopeptide (TPR) repeat protein
MLTDLPKTHLTLGKTLEAMNKLDQAMAEYLLARAAAEKQKNAAIEAETTLGRARIMVRMSATRDALSELSVLVRDNKLRAPALLLMGDCYSDLQQADKARHAYEDAVKYGPTLGEAAFKYGRALKDAGKRKPAIDNLEKALKLGGDKAPFAAEAYLLVGDSHRENKSREPAVKAYKKYLELAPPDSPGRAEVQKHITMLGGG